MENYPLIVNLVFDFCYLWSVSDLYLSLYYQEFFSAPWYHELYDFSFINVWLSRVRVWLISLLLTFGCRGHIFRFFFLFRLLITFRK